MALFTGARLNEFAPLTATDVIIDAARISSPSTSRRTKSRGAVSRPSVRRAYCSADTSRVHPNWISEVRRLDTLSRPRWSPLPAFLFRVARRLRRGVVEFVRRLQAATGNQKQSSCVPLIPARLGASCSRQRGPARRTHGSRGLLGRTDLRVKRHGEEDSVWRRSLMR